MTSVPLNADVESLLAWPKLRESAQSARLRARDLLAAVEAVCEGRQYVSAGLASRLKSQPA